MKHGNSWNENHLDGYLRLLHDAEQARRAKLELVRSRIDSGFYLTEEVAEATARRMLDAVL